MPSSTRPKVLLLIPHLGGGGAEHITEILACSLNRDRYEVHLGLVTAATSNVSDYSRFECVHQLNALRVRRSPLKLLHLIWRIRPDAILSGMAHLNLSILLLRSALPRKTRLLVRQNGELSTIFADRIHPRLARFIYGVAYRRADVVICQSESMKREIRRELRVEEAKLAVLPNPVDSGLIRKTITASGNNRIEPGAYLVAIGRLVSEKGFDILLDAFESLSRRLPDTSLQIVGCGPCEISLKQQSERLGITNRVLFTGHVQNPARFFRSATLFVHSARTEGIPNALLEAAAAGLPIVTTPASIGLTDLVKNQEGVWVASAVSALALQDALEAALASITPGHRFPHSWVGPFDIANAVPAYEAVIERTIQDAQ